MSIMILDSNFRKDNKINGEILIDSLILRIKKLTFASYTKKHL